MAIDTFTLRIKETTVDGIKPTSLTVTVYPMAANDGPRLKVVKDTTGGVILSGHVQHRATADETTAGVVDVVLPDPHDVTLDPTGFGYQVSVKTNYFQTPAVVFGPTEIAAYLSSGVLLLEDVTPGVDASFEASYALAAADSAEAAASSATSADESAMAAAGSATAAATSAGAAAGSATAADTSATNAATSATAASASASGAAGSATSAGTNATNAATSATAANTAKTGAETARTGAEAARDTTLAAQALVTAGIPNEIAGQIATALPPAVVAEVAAAGTVTAAAASAVATALAAGGILSSAQASAIAVNRAKDPQLKTTGGSGSATITPITRITSGLPPGASYGIRTTRAGTLSPTIAQICHGANNNVVDAAVTPVTPGEVIPYLFGMGWTDQSSARARLDIFWYLNGTFVSQSTGTYSNIAASTWEQRTRTNVTVPVSGVNQAVIFMTISTQSGNTVAGALAAASLFLVGTSSTYIDGTTTDCAWDGTPHLSTSRKWKLSGSTLATLEGVPARVTALEGAGGAVPLTVVKAGSALTYTSKRGSTTVANQGTLNGSGNGCYSIEGDLYAGASFRPGTDEVCPIRTHMGTVGGNHGYSCVASFTNPDGKAAADLGSLWTDGTRQYRILAITGGLPIVGAAYGSMQFLPLNGATALTLSVTNSVGTQATSSISTPAAANVQSALTGLSNVGAGKATVTSSNSVLTISFDPSLGVTTAAITASSGSPAPTISGVANWSPTVAPTSNLTHVSGATHTGAMAFGTAVSTQLYPSVGRAQVNLYTDGTLITADGTYQCKIAEIRETYDILDYGSIYDTAGANIGVSYATLPVTGAVRVSNTYRYRPGGLCEVEHSIDELMTTALARCGAIQSATITAPTRYLPGFTTADGVNWTTGVDMSAYSTDNILNASERTGSLAGSFAMDVNATGAWVVGYLPNGRRGDEQSTSAKRLAQSADPALWDMRGTDKIYPIFIDSRTPGWGRVSANAFRAILTPTESSTVLSSKSDPASAFAALDALLALTR